MSAFFKPGRSADLYLSGALSLGAGVWLFFLLRWLEGGVLPVLAGALPGPGGLFPEGALNALAEETGKLCLFPLFRLFSRLIRRGEEPETAPGLFALLAVMTFAMVENSVYFLHFPTTAIYLRLPYSYTIHLVTGTAFALLDLSGGYAFTPLLLAAATAYHAALNSLSLAVSSVPVLAAAAAGNVLLFILLAAGWRNRLTVRRFMHAGS